MIYIVSGFVRSGTSMMMRCLEAGGPPCAYDKTRDAETKTVHGYHPNPNGFYELDNLHNYADLSVFAGKVIKVLHADLFRIFDSKIPLRVVYMKRNPAEIRSSYGKMIGNTAIETFDFLYDYDAKVDRDVQRLKDAGHEATILNYADMVKSPETALASLGWPIDVNAAARAVDATLYREAQWQSP